MHFFQNLENTRVTRDEYQRVWNKVSESLMILGLEIELNKNVHSFTSASKESKSKYITQYINL
jgi:hypothetical protein